jgi:hypothetical protein
MDSWVKSSPWTDKFRCVFSEQKQDSEKLKTRLFACGVGLEMGHARGHGAPEIANGEARASRVT